MADADVDAPGTGRVDAYAYDLPAELVAQYPAERRDDARLLIVEGDRLRHGRIRDLLELVRPGDALVVNESAVFPARLLGKKPTGASAEVLLVRPAASPAGLGDPMVWEALVRPGGKLKPGREVLVGDDLRVEILDTLSSGNRVVRLVTELSLEEALDRYGRIPLPPYIEREDQAVDRERYQTVYARERGSVAAPTAGLHFTEELLATLDQRGVQRTAVTLHVGVGTFRPVEVDDPAEHTMHSEWYSVSEEAAATVNRVRAEGGRVWAVGTTAVRTLESAADEAGILRSGAGDTDLFIRPPYTFKVVDGLVTNFHLPRSTLLMLVAALAGHRRVMDAYREAVAQRYRFYSYGDAMAILPRER